MSNVLALPAKVPDFETRIAVIADITKIGNDDEMNRVAEELLDIKKLLDEIDSTFNPIIKKANEAHKEALLQKGRYATPLLAKEQTRKRLLSDYRAEQERRALAERRRVEEEQRKLLEEQAGAEFDAAVAAGDEVAAEQIAEAPIRVAPPVIPVAKPAGVSYREAWKFEVTSLAALVKHCAAHPEDLHLLTTNDTAIRQLVNARKSGFNLPGVRVWPEKTVAASRR